MALIIILAAQAIGLATMAAILGGAGDDFGAQRGRGQERRLRVWQEKRYA